MAAPHVRRFNARLEPFSAVRGFVECFCSSAGVPHRTCEKLILVIDELSTNSMLHGYRAAAGDRDEWPIWLTLSVSGCDIVALYEDAAPAHNPFDKVVSPDYSGPAEHWRIGGWGVPIISGIAANLRYEYICSHNRIHFTLRFQPPAA
jgi:serine/threonine-protein kinase RsbW